MYETREVNMKNRATALFSLALVLLFAGCGGESSSNATPGEQALVIAFDGSPTNLDARVGNDQYSGRIFDLVYAGLIRVTPDSDYGPDLAESWETPDATTIVFHLRKNVTFQDGRPLTSKDVKFTYDSVMREDFPGTKKSGYESVDSVEAPDPATVIFHLKEPNAGIFDNLTLGIVPDGADPEKFKSQPIGAGPYRILEFRPDEKVVLKAFPNYYGGPPQITNVTIRVIPDATTRVLELRKGTVNFVLNSIPLDSVKRFQDSPDTKVIAKPGAIYQYVAFNLRNRYLSHREVRQAIAHAIDRERIVRDLLLGFGRVTNTLFPPDHWAHADDLENYDYDPAKAKQLLDAAGFGDPDGDGPQTRFSLVYKTSTDAEANQQAEMIQQMLKQVGIGVEIQSNEFGVFYDDIQKGNFEMFSLRRAGVNDPDFYTFMFQSEMIPPEGQNRGYYANSRVDELLARARQTFDRSKRKEDYVEIQKILAHDLPYVSLYHRSNIAIMSRNLEGFEMYPAGFLLSVPKMHFTGSQKQGS